ncbi:MAG: hypothetical protein D6778_04755 [Nitrospirae bacterium]|nr:MAG: hypothetical protein D6778_04755 [Nitrospirota bacterium]
MKRFSVGFLCIVILFACSSKTEIKNAVIAYNRQLTEALSTGNAARLQYFATMNQIGRVDSYILYLKGEKKLLVSDLKKLKFLKIDRQGQEAKVWTEEQWVYYYIDLKTRERVSKDETVYYQTVYTLKFQDGHWMVDRVDIDKER